MPTQKERRARERESTRRSLCPPLLFLREQCQTLSETEDAADARVFDARRVGEPVARHGRMRAARARRRLSPKQTRRVEIHVWSRSLERQRECQKVLFPQSPTFGKPSITLLKTATRLSRLVYTHSVSQNHESEIMYPKSRDRVTLEDAGAAPTPRAARPPWSPSWPVWPLSSPAWPLSPAWPRALRRVWRRPPRTRRTSSWPRPRASGSSSRTQPRQPRHMFSPLPRYGSPANRSAARSTCSPVTRRASNARAPMSVFPALGRFSELCSCALLSTRAVCAFSDTRACVRAEKRPHAFRARSNDRQPSDVFPQPRANQILIVFYPTLRATHCPRHRSRACEPYREQIIIRDSSFLRILTSPGNPRCGKTDRVDAAWRLSATERFRAEPTATDIALDGTHEAETRSKSR